MKKHKEQKEDTRAKSLIHSPAQRVTDLAAGRGGGAAAAAKTSSLGRLLAGHI
jgi:hypothetical protein